MRQLCCQGSRSASDIYRDIFRVCLDVLRRGHMDGGATASTTNLREALWFCRLLRSRVLLRIADDVTYSPTHEGFLKVPDRMGYTFVHCYYTIEIPATIISPHSTMVQLGCHTCTTHIAADGTGSFVRLGHRDDSSAPVIFDCTTHNGLLYTEPFILPTASEHAAIWPNPLHYHIRAVHMLPGAGEGHSTERDGLTAGKGFTVGEGVTSSNPAGEGTPSTSGCCSTCVACSGGSVAAVNHTCRANTVTALDVRKVTDHDTNFLWHARFCHLHHRALERMVANHTALGLPASMEFDHTLDKCPICLATKCTKAWRSKISSRRASECYVGIAIDFGFIVQKSKDTERYHHLRGLNGETCYCIITDHFSGTCWGRCFSSKAAPIDFLTEWLHRYGLPKEYHGSQNEGKYVRFDRGGELGKNHEVLDLFEKAGYSVEPAPPNSSNSNGPGERPHRTIGDALRAMLAGAKLAYKFWPYAFYHYIRLYNLVPHADKDKSPYELCSGKVPDVSFLRVFGCRVFVIPPRPRRPSKLEHDVRTGIYLGHARTARNILYYDVVSHEVKESSHVSFDETSFDVQDKAPNAELLTRLHAGESIDDVFETPVDIAELDVALSPFLRTQTLEISYDRDTDQKIGLSFTDCSKLGRAFVYNFTKAPANRSLKWFRKNFELSYIVSLAGVKVYNAKDVHTVLRSLDDADRPPKLLEIVLAPERRADLKDRPTPLHMRTQDIRYVDAILSNDPGNMSPAQYRQVIDEYAQFPAERQDYHTDDAGTSTFRINRLQTDGMTEEEKQLKSFSYRNLKRLSNWPEWRAARNKQLDSHFDDGCLGHPIPKSQMKHVDGMPPNLLRIVWSNIVKADGKRKMRACCDGSKRGAPWLRQFTNTYSSCIEMPCLRLYFALIALLGYVVTLADTTNAYQQAPPPKVACYLRIDEPYRDWYKERFGKDVNPETHVIPMDGNLQGLPPAGNLWEGHINSHLIGKIGLRNTTHERNLYRGVFEGSDTLLCRQVDDYAAGTGDPDTAERLIANINQFVTTESKGIGELVEGKGMHCVFNGVDVYQTRDYIKISCDTYIDRLLLTHGWSDPSSSERTTDSPPISEDVAQKISQLVGPTDKTAEHAELEREMQFSYRTLLGALMFSYVVCRVDIAYAICFLARFASHPAKEHYGALKNVARYLRRTKDWGIIYWRTKPVESLPRVDFEEPPLEEGLPEYPQPDPFELIGLVDAAYATDQKTRKSITGFVFQLAGGAIAYKSKLQPVVAVSSSECELYAAVHAAKVAKYLRTILHELDFTQQKPTMLYEDNQAVIKVVNQERPTSNLRHVDIQHFAIQEWRRRGEIELDYISTLINSSDAATKGLSWTLHHRHVRHSMGHRRPDWAPPAAN